MSVQFLSQGYSVIINIISETVIAFFLTITDEKELLFILGIIASLFVKFVIINASPKNTGSTTTTGTDNNPKQYIRKPNAWYYTYNISIIRI